MNIFFLKKHTILLLPFLFGWPIAATIVEQDNIAISYIDYKNKDDEVLFYTTNNIPLYAKRFINYGIRPVQVVMHNKTSQAITLNKGSVASHASFTDIQDCVFCAPYEAMVLTGGCGLFMSLFVSLSKSWLATGGAVATTIVAALLVGHKISANQIVLLDTLNSKIINAPVILAPGSRVEKIIFIDEASGCDVLDIHFYNKNGVQVTHFNIPLSPSNNKDK